MNQPKRNLRIWIPIAAVLCFWLGNWMGHTYELTEGTTTHRLAAALNLNSLLLHPFRLSADAFSLGCGIAAALMAGLIYLCVKYSKHRLMPQKEYGSARWGGPEDIAPFLDENAQNNLPLTASESLSLSPKMKVTANDNYNRNKNVIVFGPSGSGKSYSVAGPQLLQFNSNYVLSDPKGELLQEYGNVLLSQGYKVKVFNLKDRDKSDHYNLFTYIKMRMIFWSSPRTLSKPERRSHRQEHRRPDMGGRHDGTAGGTDRLCVLRIGAGRTEHEQRYDAAPYAGIAGEWS